MSNQSPEQVFKTAKERNIKREELRTLTIENKMACRNMTIDIFDDARAALQELAPQLKVKADGSLNKKSKELVDKLTDEHSKNGITVSVYTKLNKLHVQATHHYNVHRLTVNDHTEEVVGRSIRLSDYVWNLDTSAKSSLVQYTKYTKQDVIEAEKKEAELKEEVQMLQNELTRCENIINC